MTPRHSVMLTAAMMVLADCAPLGAPLLLRAPVWSGPHQVDDGRAFVVARCTVEWDRPAEELGVAIVDVLLPVVG